MTPTPLDEDSLGTATLEEIHSALFVQLVSGHAQMALMLLGKLPNLHTGELEPVNLEAAKMFIDQLEMIEAKTKGNRTPGESATLSELLNSVRLEFVAVMENPASDDRPETPPSAAEVS
jgi:hypothetical protein